MRLVRYGKVGNESPGLLDGQGNMRSLVGIVPDIDSQTLASSTLDSLRNLDIQSLPIVPEKVRLGPCVATVGKIICIGLNYRDHAKEAGLAEPAEPIIFLKAVSAITGPFDHVELPKEAQKTDWEVELGVVIGTKAKYVNRAEALQYVAGYCVVNDVSERSYQLERGGQWAKGKGCDTFAPIGPYLVTRDEIPDPQKLHLWLEVDGKRYQDGTTADMIFNVEFLVAYVSQFMTLYPGDIIATGTPAGVGMGQLPPVYLKAGQVITLGIQGLGQQKSLVVSNNTDHKTPW